MAARRLTYIALDDLEPATRNPKAHDSGLVSQSVTRFGFIEPVVLDERTNRLVAGHGRRDDLIARRDAGEPPPEGVTVKGGKWHVAVVRGWASADDAEAEAAGVALNQSTIAGGWDDAQLASMLAELAESERGLDGLGFDQADLDALIKHVEFGARVALQGDPDEVPEPPKVAVTKPGDLWVLGEHRVLCGDATEKDDVDRVLVGEHLAGAVITDPPYGVAIGAKNRALDEIDRAGRVLTDLEGDQGIEEVEALWRGAFAVLMKTMPPGMPYYVFGPQGGDLGLLLLQLLRDAGLSPRHVLIWVKNRPSFSIGRLDYDYQHEPIIYGWRPGGPHPWHADGTRTSILNFDRPQASPEHPTTKPVALVAHLVENSTAPGELVIDPFAGSGTAAVAAQGLGRRARLIEISPAYCDVICARFQRVSGIVPVREGVPHDFLAE